MRRENSDAVKDQLIWKEDKGLFITKFKSLHFYKCKQNALLRNWAVAMETHYLYPLKRDYFFTPAFS